MPRVTAYDVKQFAISLIKEVGYDNFTIDDIVKITKKQYELSKKVFTKKDFLKIRHILEKKSGRKSSVYFKKVGKKKVPIKTKNGSAYKYINSYKIVLNK